MDAALSAAELDDRIAMLRDNVRQLIEQAAVAAGEGSDELISERLARQNDELDRLVAQRAALGN